jgi:VWFA-related protein
MTSLPALSRCALAALTVCVLFATPLTQAQDASPAQSATAAPSIPNAAPAQATSPAPNSDDQTPTMTIRQTVRRVILDVMVRDADGKPVHGLSASDFSITEDKQPQRVLSFDVYDFDKPSISRGPNAPPLPPNVFVNVPDVPERGPLYVMLYDLVNTEMEDQMTARGQILKFISSKPEGTRFAIFVNSDKVYLAQGFTADKDLLYAALDSKNPRHRVPRVFLYGRNYGARNPYTAIDVLTHIGQYLDGIPGRKNLIWVAGTFPTAIYAIEGNPVDASERIRAEMNALAQAEVAVFPVNVRGVVVSPEGGGTGAMPHGGAGGAATGSGPISFTPSGGSVQGTGSGSSSGPVVSGMAASGASGVQGADSLSGDYTAQEAMAKATGGRAFYSDNGLAEGLEEVTEDGGNYYTLTYSPPNAEEEGKCHGISVKLDKPQYQLSYRRSYCRVPLVLSAADLSSGGARPADLAVPLEAGDVLQANMKMGGPMVHDLVFSAHVRTAGGVTTATPEQMAQLTNQSGNMRVHRRNPNARPVPPVRVRVYAVDYRVLEPELKTQAGRTGRQPTLEFAIAAFDNDGKLLNGMVNDGVADPATQASDNKAGIYRTSQALVVPLNAVSIRVGVRDRIGDRIGTLEIPLPLAPERVAQATPPVH